MFTWKEDWIVFMLNELLDIMVFFHVGVTFSPLHDRLLTRAFDGTVTQAIANEAEAH